MIVDFDGKLFYLLYVICSYNHIKGNIYEDLSFEYGEQTRVSYSCGATLMGEFWIFGGQRHLDYERQVSNKVKVNYLNKTTLRQVRSRIANLFGKRI